MIIGAHVILYSRKAEADRKFLSSVMRFPSVDVGGGWLIFGLPPSEVAIHPAQRSGRQEFYLMCEDVEDFISDMRTRGLRCSRVRQLSWGRLTKITLPGGGRIGVYQPLHKRPRPAKVDHRRQTR